jgi:hypothetical protein
VRRAFAKRSASPLGKITQLPDEYGVGTIQNGPLKPFVLLRSFPLHACARSAEIDRPNVVVRAFQVSLNKVEPVEAVLARNLLTKDDWRADHFDEVEKRGP